MPGFWYVSWNPITNLGLLLSQHSSKNKLQKRKENQFTNTETRYMYYKKNINMGTLYIKHENNNNITWYLLINHKICVFILALQKVQHFNKFTIITGLNFLAWTKIFQWLSGFITFTLEIKQSFASFPFRLVRRQWQCVSILSLFNTYAIN